MPDKFGLLTTNQWPAKYIRVWYEDNDVTQLCLAADDKRGWVVLLERNAQGALYLRDHQGERVVACVVACGTVWVEWDTAHWSAAAIDICERRFRLQGTSPVDPCDH